MKVIAIYAINIDGTNETNLTNSERNDYDPKWSPNRSKIAFVAGPDGSTDIFVMNTNGSNQTKLTSGPAQNSKPAWSPDDTKIAYRSISGRTNGIYTMNADGSQQILLASIPTALNGVCVIDNVELSPDGSKILFDAMYPDSNKDIFTVYADGSNFTNLTNSPESADNYPSWSPDGAKIAFASPRDGDWDIYDIDPDGSNETKLTNSVTTDSSPRWSPDSMRIAFTSGSDIYVMNADGTGHLKLTEGIATISVLLTLGLQMGIRYITQLIRNRQR